MSQSSDKNIEICVVGMLSALRIANKAKVAPAGIPAEPMLAKAANMLFFINMQCIKRKS